MIKTKLKRLVHKIKQNKHFWRNFALFCAGVFIFMVAALMLWISSFRIPDFDSFEARKIVNSTKIYDRTGEVLLYDIFQNVRRTNIPFSEMGTNIKNATVAVEDSEFYNHPGIRISSIIRATIWAKLTGKRVTGGSTITQQLVKNTLLNSEKALSRKLKEWVLAVKIDSSLSKEKILELYLNEVPYGGTIYGIEEAAKTYFGKSAIDLTLAEAAYLASIPQSPTYLSPYGKNFDKLVERKNFVLFRMKEVGFITEEEYEQAKNEEVAFLPASAGGIRAPHFVFFIKDYLEKKYGADVIENGGLKVITTIDYDLQQKAEEFVKEGALQNEKDWGGENAALVAIDPNNGQILTMVGSRDYFDKDIDGNYNVATAHRQPGSSFKPFIYATAFNKGFTDNTVLFDVPTEFNSSCDPYGHATGGRSQSNCYMPQNFDGGYRGPMKLRDALAQSINIPAVKLFYLAGLNDSLKTAEDMGITTLTDISRYGLTLVIGGGEVSLLDMTSAYGVFANDGVREPYSGIMQVEDGHGKILEKFEQDEKEVLPKNTALLLSDILSDNAARTPTFGANSQLVIPGREVAVKTGTTNSNRDAWIIGYTPSIVAGVWAGNNDNTPMKKGGAAMAGPIWNKFMQEALKNVPNETFEEPLKETDPDKLKPVLRGSWQGNESFFVDAISGKLATDLTPPETRTERVITNVHSILYWVDKNDIMGPAPTNPGKDPQFKNWEVAVQDWWAKNSGNYPAVSSADRPGVTDDIHTSNDKPNIFILEPNSMTEYEPDQVIQLRVNSTGKYPLSKIDIFINDVYMGTSNAPFTFSFRPEDLDDFNSKNEIKVIGYDTVYSRGEATATFKVND